MFSLSHFFLFTLAVVSVLADYSSVLAALKNPIDPDVLNIKALVDKFPTPGAQGTGVATLSLKNAQDKLIKDFNSVNSDLKNSQVPTSQQAQAVFNYFFNTPLFNDTQAELTSYKSKSANLINGGFKSSTRAFLTNQKKAYQDFADALMAKGPVSAFPSGVQNSKSQYDKIFDEAIAVYT